MRAELMSISSEPGGSIRYLSTGHRLEAHRCLAACRRVGLIWGKITWPGGKARLRRPPTTKKQQKNSTISE
eukprot:1506950-Rhodomonas_salina.1